MADSSAQAARIAQQLQLPTLRNQRLIIGKYKETDPTLWHELKERTQETRTCPSDLPDIGALDPYYL